MGLRRLGIGGSAALLSGLLTVVFYTGSSAAQDQLTVPTTVGRP